MNAPLANYQKQEAILLEQNRELAKKESLAGQAKIVLFLLFLVACWFSLAKGSFNPIYLLLFLPPFLLFLFVHDKVTRKWQQADRELKFVQGGIARLTFKWQGNGNPGLTLCPNGHPFALDLDLFGKGSLFELICIAKTLEGQKVLAKWLLATPTKKEIQDRQKAIAELQPMMDLRQEMHGATALKVESVELSALSSWGILPSQLVTQIPLVLGVAFGCFGLFSIHAAAVLGWGLAPLALAITLNIFLQGAFARPTLAIYQKVDQLSGSLGLVSRILSFLEKSSFQSSHLLELQSGLKAGDGGTLPSQQISSLAGWMTLANAMKNQIFFPLGFLLNWPLVVAYGMDQWRLRHGIHINDWLKTLGEFEALQSLANFAYEHPDAIFPTVDDSLDGYHATNLSHPLMPLEVCVRNDAEIGGSHSLIIISGSNMSGKSTYLRTVGINAVLAYAGAPVLASSMSIRPMAIAAVLRIQDSLAEGKSRFYAEIQRIRQVVDIADGPIPAFFLLDEIFSGTNSHDRKLGAEGVLKGLIRRKAVGIVTTHDLSLATIADDPVLNAVNKHFADKFEQGNLNFDYRMKPGVVQHSNALELMRAVGLEVPQRDSNS